MDDLLQAICIQFVRNGNTFNTVTSVNKFLIIRKMRNIALAFTLVFSPETMNSHLTLRDFENVRNFEYDIGYSSNSQSIVLIDFLQIFFHCFF